jgi:hypothetical protein
MALSAFAHADPPVPWFAEKRAHPFVPLNNLVAAAGAVAGLPLFGRHKASRSLVYFALMLFLACVLAIQIAAPSRAWDRTFCTYRYAAFIVEAARRFNSPGAPSYNDVQRRGNVWFVFRDGSTTMRAATDRPARP